MATAKRKFALDNASPSSRGSDEHGKKVKLDTDDTNPSRKPSALLGLPGELRNRIYDFVLLDVPDCASYDQIDERQHFDCPRMARNTHANTRPLPMNLNHVCRLIRQEFRPLYRAKLHVRVPLALLDDYLAVFDQDGAGDITISDTHLITSKAGVNILPFYNLGPTSLSIKLEPPVIITNVQYSSLEILRSYVRRSTNDVRFLVNADALKKIRLLGTEDGIAPEGSTLVEYHVQTQGRQWDPEGQDAGTKHLVDCCSKIAGWSFFRAALRVAT